LRLHKRQKRQQKQRNNMKAQLNNLRMSPRKVRLVADTVRGKSVAEARAILSFMPKVSALPLLKLLDGAVKNAANVGNTSDVSALKVSELYVNQGKTLKRHMPRAHGSAYQILKRTSKITLILADKSK